MSEPIYNHGIPVYAVLNVTIDDVYRCSRVTAEDGRKYSLHRTSYHKNSGHVRVPRYIRPGMKFRDVELIDDWRDEPRGEIHGIVRIHPDK